MIITSNTFQDMQVAFFKILDEGGSIEDLDNYLKQYKHNLPVITQYFHAYYHYRHNDFQKASDIITSVLEQIEKGTESLDDIILYWNRVLKDIYYLAGEIFANNNLYDEALHAFQDYQLCICRIKSMESSQLLSFRSYNDYSLSDLINGEITVCSPIEMNDPYDTLLIKWGEYSRIKKAERKHIKPFCDSLDSYRIRSFTKLKDDDDKDMTGNILMWSHYAGQHSGFCIQYSFSSNYMKVEEERRTIRFRNIIYPPKTKLYDITSDKINTDDALCTKHAYWSYENEVRMIAYEPDIKGHFHQIQLDEKSHINSIYFGYRCTQKRIDTIKKILESQTNIKFYKMESDFTDIFRLIPKEI